MTNEESEGGRIQWVPDPYQEVERLKSIVETDIEELQAAENDFEEIAGDELGNHLLLYFTLTHSSIERYSENILWSRLNSEGYEPSEKSAELLEGHSDDRDYMRQRLREDLLFYEDVIDNGLKSQMAETRYTRNALVHDPHERVSLSSVEEVDSKVDLAFKAATTMNEKWTEELGRGDVEVID
jgi:hypothetical protein